MSSSECIINKFELSHSLLAYVKIGDNLGFTQAIFIRFYSN